DKERALTNQGQHDAIQLGGYLKKTSCNIHLIISSPANRAQSTAWLVARQIDFDANHIQVEESIYSSNKAGILKLLNTLNDSVKEVLLIGHYPTIVELYNYLAMNESKTTMNTAELCSLKFDLCWSEVTRGTGSEGSAFYPHSI
ncbi:MAG: histidine phosphatase family protein, partial [Cyclobacteriaceae bacterium]